MLSLPCSLAVCLVILALRPPEPDNVVDDSVLGLHNLTPSNLASPNPTASDTDKTTMHPHNTFADKSIRQDSVQSGVVVRNGRDANNTSETNSGTQRCEPSWGIGNVRYYDNSCTSGNHRSHLHHDSDNHDDGYKKSCRNGKTQQQDMGKDDNNKHERKNIKDTGQHTIPDAPDDHDGVRDHSVGEGDGENDPAGVDKDVHQNEVRESELATRLDSNIGTELCLNLDLDSTPNQISIQQHVQSYAEEPEASRAIILAVEPTEMRMQYSVAGISTTHQSRITPLSAQSTVDPISTDKDKDTNTLVHPSRRAFVGTQPVFSSVNAGNDSNNARGDPHSSRRARKNGRGWTPTGGNAGYVVSGHSDRNRSPPFCAESTPQAIPNHQKLNISTKGVEPPTPPPGIVGHNQYPQSNPDRTPEAMSTQHGPNTLAIDVRPPPPGKSVVKINSPVFVTPGAYRPAVRKTPLSGTKWHPVGGSFVDHPTPTTSRPERSNASMSREREDSHKGTHTKRPSPHPGRQQPRSDDGDLTLLSGTMSTPSPCVRQARQTPAARTADVIDRTTNSKRSEAHDLEYTGDKDRTERHGRTGPQGATASHQSNSNEKYDASKPPGMSVHAGTQDQQWTGECGKVHDKLATSKEAEMTEHTTCSTEKASSPPRSKLGTGRERQRTPPHGVTAQQRPAYFDPAPVHSSLGATVEAFSITLVPPGRSEQTWQVNRTQLHPA
ncbi:hypothetical protein SARC_11689, partial [Sphaeroforma arctica JP610]